MEKYLMLERWKQKIYSARVIKRIKKCYYKNRDNIFYIIKRDDPNVGIFSCILTFLSHLKYAEEMGYIPVIDMKHFDNEYIYPEQKGIVNAWDFYFEQPAGVSLDIAYGASKIVLSEGHFKPGYTPSEEFLNSKVSEDYDEWKRLWKKYIHFNDDTLKYLEENYQKIVNEAKTENILGVLCRGSDYFWHTEEQYNAFDKLVFVVQNVRKILEEKNIEHIFLATEDEGILQLFKKEFGEKILYIEDERVDGKKEQRLLGEVWKEKKINLREKGLKYILNIYILSKCKCFIGTRTSGSVFLPIMSDIKDMFFFDLVNIEKELEEMNGL